MSAHVVDRLSAFLDRELTEAEASVVRQHLADCEACAARVRELEGVDQAFAAVPADAPPGYFDSFADRVRSRIEAAPLTVRPASGPSASRMRLPAWSWAVAAAILLGMLLPRLPWDGGRPRSRAESEGQTAGPRDAARERYAAEPASPVPPATTELADLPLRPSPETAVPGPAAAPAPLASPDDARVGDAFAHMGLDAKIAAPAVVAPPSEARASRLVRATPVPVPGAPGVVSLLDAAEPRQAPSVPLRPQAKKDGGGRLADQMSNEASTAPLAEAQLRVREEGAQGARPTEARSGAVGFEKSEADEMPADAAAAVVLGAVVRDDAQEAKRRGAPPLTAAAKEAPAGKEAPVAKGSPATAEAEFESLATRPAKSLRDLRLLRAAWHSFLVRHPEGARADAARVAVITLSVEIAVRSGDAADEADARGQAQTYLTREDAAQKARVQTLLARLGGGR